MTNPETQLASFFAKYEPAMVKLGKALRAKLRARLPGLFEIVYVYESQNSLVISYSPTEQGYHGLCSIALYPDRVNLPTLSFLTARSGREQASLSPPCGPIPRWNGSLHGSSASSRALSA